MEPYLYRGTEASEASSNKIARYHIQICVYDTEAYLAKIENLEYETHGNWIFSIFLRVDSLKKKCLSLEYLWWFFEICPGAINPEEFLLSNVRIVQWLPFRLQRCIATINRWTDYCNNREIIVSNYWLSQKHRKIIGPDSLKKTITPMVMLTLKNIALRRW